MWEKKKVDFCTAVDLLVDVVCTAVLKRCCQGVLVQSAASQSSSVMGCLMLGTWKQAESAAYLWDNIAAGAVLSTNIFFNIALRHLASVAAGCRPASENDDGACAAHVYGLKPSSMVTTVVMVGQMAWHRLTILCT